MIHTFGKKQDKNSDQVINTKVMFSYLNFLNEGYKSFGLNPKQKASLIKKRSQYSYDGSDLNEKDRNHLMMFIKQKNHFANHGLDSIFSCSQAVSEFRRERKNKSAIYTNKADGKKVFTKERNYQHGYFNGQAVNSKYAVLTEAFAKKWWDDNQARTNIKITSDALRCETAIKPSPIGRNDNWNYYENYNEIFLSPSWFKNVYMKGMATTVYKSKRAFVASVKPIEVSERITATGLQGYMANLITCHDGIISLEKNLYFLAYKTHPWTTTTVGDNEGNIPFRGHNEKAQKLMYNNIVYETAKTINCASNNFRQAENVMSGRVQKSILNAMGV
jgi:hypothetical protein